LKADEMTVALKPVHPWLKTLHVTFVPGFTTPLLDKVASALKETLGRHGHYIQDVPDEETDLALTTACFGKPTPWRKSLFFQARRQFGLHHTPTVLTMLHVQPQQWTDLLTHFAHALAKQIPDANDFNFPGLATSAYHTLIEQGRRGGPVLAIERLMQAQTMCLRLLVVVGDDQPHFAYHFDLVGGSPRSDGDSQAFYDDIALRLATVVSLEETGGYSVQPPMIARATWESLQTPAAMRAASLELGARNFFTQMVRIADLVHVPALADVISSQYSEGCFATWEPQINALITTVTGGARPVDKSNITEDDLAVVAGTQMSDKSVHVRHVERIPNDPPSSEAFEMMDIVSALPMISLDGAWGTDQTRAPVIRSQLHGHRGVASYDPQHVEYVPMEPVYFHYPVTCRTQAQAYGLKSTFVHSEALRNPGDPRHVVFTLLPTHGVFIVEKWVPGKSPLQTIWEYMDAGYLQVESTIPQGPELYIPTRHN
jgi:hypothetical protein